MPFAAIPFIRVLSSKGISICNEETIVARRSIGFLIFIQRSFGNTSKAIFDGRIGAIQRELQQFPNPNEVVSLESNEQQQLLRISLRSITPEIVESLPNETARCAPKCERTVQAVSCRNLNVESATPPNAISSRRIRLRDDIVTGFHFSVSDQFVPCTTDTKKAFLVEPIREGLVVSRWYQEWFIEMEGDPTERKGSIDLLGGGAFGRACCRILSMAALSVEHLKVQLTYWVGGLWSSASGPYGRAPKGP